MRKGDDVAAQRELAFLFACEPIGDVRAPIPTGGSMRTNMDPQTVALAVSLLFAGVACGPKMPATAGADGEATIGAAGGMLVSEDGNVVLAVPAGAVDADT